MRVADLALELEVGLTPEWEQAVGWEAAEKAACHAARMH